MLTRRHALVVVLVVCTLLVWRGSRVQQGPTTNSGTTRPHGLAHVPTTFHALELGSTAALWQPPPAGAVDASRWVVYLHSWRAKADELYVRGDTPWRRCFEREAGVLMAELGPDPWLNASAVSHLDALLRWARDHQGARSFVLVGFSMGGSQALAFAAMGVRPDIAGVIALSPTPDMRAYARWTQEAGRKEVVAWIGRTLLAAHGGDSGSIFSVLDDPQRLWNAAPVYVVMGASDDIIDPQWSRKLAQAAARSASNARFALVYQELPGGVHTDPLSSATAALKSVGLCTQGY